LSRFNSGIFWGHFGRNQQVFNRRIFQILPQERTVGGVFQQAPNEV